MKINRIVLALILLPAVCTLAASLTAFSGPAAWTMAEGWAWHPMKDETYTENWLTVVQTDQGGFVLVNFLVSNAGLGSNIPGAGVNFYLPDGKVFSNDIKLNSSDLNIATDRLDLRVADLRLWKEGNAVKLKIPRGRIKLDLSIAPAVGAWRHGNGRILLGNPTDAWNWAMLVPRGRVSGSIIADGTKYNAAGYAYLDHTWSNKGFFEYSRNWLSLRIHGKKRTYNFVQMVATKNYGDGTVRSLMIAEDGKPVRGTGNVKLQVNASKSEQGYSHPTDFTVSGDCGGAKVEIRASNVHGGEILDPLRSLSGVERAAIRLLVTKPVLYQLVMDTSITVTENGVTETEKLPAIAGMLYFAQ